MLARTEDILIEWPQYSKMIHDTIMEAPDQFYFEMDNSAHRRVVHSICKHYGFTHTSEIVKTHILDQPPHIQEEIIAECGVYHPGKTQCEDCGWVELDTKRIIINKNTLKKDVKPLEFDVESTKCLTRPTVYPLPN